MILPYNLEVHLRRRITADLFQVLDGEFPLGCNPLGFRAWGANFADDFGWHKCLRVSGNYRSFTQPSRNLPSISRSGTQQISDFKRSMSGQRLRASSNKYPGPMEADRSKPQKATVPQRKPK